MLINFFEVIAKDLVKEILPPMQRYFTYFFIIVGIAWLGGANYYYYIDNLVNFKGTLITGLIFFSLAFISGLWEYYSSSKKDLKSNYNEIMVKILPIILPLLFNILNKTFRRSSIIKTLVVAGIAGIILYYKFRGEDKK